MVSKGGLTREKRTIAGTRHGKDIYSLICPLLPRPGERHNNMAMTMAMTSMGEVTCTLVSA